MSDAVREVKSDDALSSVRRLVGHSSPRQEPLLLTPDLRVLPQPEQKPTAPMLSLEETIAGLEDALLSRPGDWEEEDTSRNLFTAKAQDKDSLRPIVAELVREELRGALGEKITHAVRKMVQAEVSRSLAARDLR